MDAIEAPQTRAGIGEITAFYLWLFLNFFAQPFVLLAGFLTVLSIPEIVQPLNARGNLYERIVILPSLFGLVSAYLGTCGVFPAFYMARFQSVGFGTALAVIGLAGTTLWLGLVAIDEASELTLFSGVPNASALVIPYIIAAVAVAVNTAFIGPWRRLYRLFYSEGGFYDRWRQRDARFYLGEAAWRRYYEWLWGHPPLNEGI